MIHDDDRLLTIKEAAALLGLSVGTAYHKVSRKELPVVRLSPRCIRFRLGDLRTLIAMHTELPANTDEHWRHER